MRSIKEMMSLKGRVAVVTGGAGHIGAAMAESLVEAGATVVLSDLSAENCQKAAAEINAKDFSGKAEWIECNIADEKLSRQMINDVAKKYGSLDTLIHSAALVGTSNLKGWSVPFPEQSVEAWDLAMRVNLTSAFYLSQEAAPYLKKSGHGSISFVISTYGLVGPDWKIYDGTKMGNPFAYGASKAGLIQLMRYLSTNLAPDVRVNVITPGGVERGQPEVFQERYRSKTPLGRMSVEEDYKGAALYLSSDLSAYVTGHNLVVDGGWTVW